MNGLLIISSRIGTPIFSREYVPSFGLLSSESIFMKMPATNESAEVRDGAEGVIGESSSLVGKTQHISDISLSGLLYALKLNAEMCFKPLDVMLKSVRDDTSSVIESVNDIDLMTYYGRDESTPMEECLKSFSIGKSSLYFCEDLDTELFCVVFLDNFLLCETALGDGRNKSEGMGRKIARSICHK